MEVNAPTEGGEKDKCCHLEAKYTNYRLRRSEAAGLKVNEMLMKHTHTHTCCRAVKQRCQT